VSFGILDPLYDAVGWLIMRIHAVLAPLLGASSGITWVLTIVVLVVLLRLLLLPLFVKQMHSQRKMLALAPQMQELRKRYKGDKQKLNEEMMKMYKENGANPLSGCLPLVAQLPVWFALLNVLRAMTEDKPLYTMTPTVVHEALKAHIFGVTVASKFLFQNSTVHTKIVIAVTVVLSAVTTFATVRQSMKRGMMQTPTVDQDNPMAGAQKYMAYIAPLFALSGLYWQFGLVIYWLASNLWTLGQQYFLFKKIPPLNAAAAAATAAAAPPPTVRTTTVKSVTSTAARRPGSAAKQVSGTARQSAGTAKQPTSAARQATGSAKQSTGTARQATGTAKQSANAKQSASTAANSAAAKPAGTNRPAGAAAKASGAAKQPARTAKTGPAAKPSSPADGQPAAAKAGSGRKSAAAKTDPASLGIPPPIANGSGGGNVLRKLVGRRAEPEPEPEPAEVTIVRQQRVKQSRSKRTGKR
jgi:YidC/Oxa1 family membrane protein insertase